MRGLKISTALLAVPLCLGALACENPIDTEQPDALSNPPAPSFSFHTGPVPLGNGCLDVLDSGVTTRKGGKEVVGTDFYDYIDCRLYNLPGSKGVTVKAGKGNDWVIGSPRDDDLSGGMDCDRVVGLNGNDVVDGGPGNDSGLGLGGCFVTVGVLGGLFGGNGADLVKGGTGNDFISGSPGPDVCEGGKGSDSFNLCDECSDPDGDCP